LGGSPPVSKSRRASEDVAFPPGKEVQSVNLLVQVRVGVPCPDSKIHDLVPVFRLPSLIEGVTKAAPSGGLSFPFLH
jgi:hypothetical protein